MAESISPADCFNTPKLISASVEFEANNTALFKSSSDSLKYPVKNKESARFTKARQGSAGVFPFVVYSFIKWLNLFTFFTTFSIRFFDLTKYLLDNLLPL